MAPSGDATEQHSTVNHRNLATVRRSLEQWLQNHLPGAAITALETSGANDQSIKTILFTVTHEAGIEQLVARVAPDPADSPAVSTNDLGAQFRTISIVADRSDAPVPTLRWLEIDPSVLGAGFVVMDRVEGRVLSDLLPYTFGSWLTEATEAERQALQDDTIWTIAGIHEADLSDIDTGFLEYDVDGDTHLRRHVNKTRADYEWIRAGRTIPVIEAAFDWVESHWPADDGGEPVLLWGDAHIGNMLFDGFRPAAVLDWKMAAMGPRGIDVGSCVFIHSFFQYLAETMELPGLPGFMGVPEVAAVYETRTGVDLSQLQWYETYAALRHTVIMCRAHDQRVAFGEEPAARVYDETVIHRDLLYRMISS